MATNTGLYPLANNWIQQTPGAYFPGSTVAGFTPEQSRAWQLQQMGANMGAGQANKLWGSYANEMQNFNPSQNPWLDKAVDAMRESSSRDFERNQIPNIYNTAINAGGFGGSRQAITEGLARSDLNRDMMNTEATMRNNAYGQGLQYKGNLYGMGPQQLQAASAAWAAPGAVSQSIADQQRGMNQSRLNDEFARWQYQRDLAGNRINQYGQMLGQVQGGVQSGQQFPTSNPWTSALGGGMAGYSLYNNLSGLWGNNNQAPNNGMQLNMGTNSANWGVYPTTPTW